MWNIMFWMGRHPVDEVVRMVSDACGKIREDGSKVATIGFCWGTWVLYQAQKSKIEMEGCVCMHPSLFTEDMQGRSHSDLIAF
jgi:dienelactone hydrolase